MTTEEIQKDVLAVLNNCQVEGSTIHLPGEPIDTALFSEIKKLFKPHSGKYNKTTKSFSFESMPAAEAFAAVIKELSAEEEPDQKQKRIVKEKRTLRYDFSNTEVHELSLQLAGENKRKAQLEEEKKSVSAQYSAKIKESTATINKLSNLVENGWEFRETQVEIQYHVPEEGKKTVLRLDVNTSLVERMEPWEFNLFTQPVDEEWQKELAI